MCVIISKTMYLYSFPNTHCTLLGLLQETQDVHFVLKETLGETEIVISSAGLEGVGHDTGIQRTPKGEHQCRVLPSEPLQSISFA